MHKGCFKFIYEYFKGQPGEGFVIAMKQLEKARIGIASQALGIGQAALDLAVDYSSTRKAFGQPINQLQAVKVIFCTLINVAGHFKVYFAA